MGNFCAVVCSLALVCAHIGTTLLSSSPALPPGPPEPQVSPAAAQVISVGEEVRGVLTTDPGGREMIFELTAPSDGTLVVHLSPGDVYLILEDVFWWPKWRYPAVFSTIGTLQVVAGQSYRIRVWTSFYYYYHPGSAPFVLTTSLATGPVTIPPACESVRPGGDWVCVDGGWVPRDHPLADPKDPPPPPPDPPDPPPPPPPPIEPVDCPSIKPGATWVCVDGGWVPPDHPLAPQQPPPPPPQPPVPPTLTVAPTEVALGAEVTLTWAAPTPSSSLDWIGLFRIGAANVDYLETHWVYTQGATSGTWRLRVPHEPGQYEFRYLLDDGYVDVARSAAITVSALLARQAGEKPAPNAGSSRIRTMQFEMVRR